MSESESAFQEKSISNSSQGMGAFMAVWIGQLISLIGSGLSSFALTLWVYQHSGSVTQYALMLLLAMLPGLLVAPLAGAVVDRWDRRWVMVVSDSGAALGTVTMLILLSNGQLQVWHIGLYSAINAALGAFQRPAFSSLIPMLVSKENLVRANGLVQMAWGVSMVISPALAGLLLVNFSAQTVLIVDLSTFLIAVLVLIFIRVPKLEISAEAKAAQTSFKDEVAYGWKYLQQRPGLMGLLVIGAAVNFQMAMLWVLSTPLIIAVASPSIVGAVVSVGGIGLTAGGIAIGVWGGPKRRVYGAISILLFAGVGVLLGGVRPYIPLFFIAAFASGFAVPFVQGCANAILQTKTPTDVQGRIFALNNMLSGAMFLLAYLVSGVLADAVFEPMFADKNGLLAGSIGNIIGVGTGRGLGFMLILTGFFCILLAIAAFIHPRIRKVEIELPDIESNKDKVSIS